jgi:hypothetical protein
MESTEIAGLHATSRLRARRLAAIGASALVAMVAGATALGITPAHAATVPSGWDKASNTTSPIITAPAPAHFRAFAASRRSVKARSRWVCRSSVRSVHHRRMATE